MYTIREDPLTAQQHLDKAAQILASVEMSYTETAVDIAAATYGLLVAQTHAAIAHAGAALGDPAAPSAGRGAIKRGRGRVARTPAARR